MGVGGEARRGRAAARRGARTAPAAWLARAGYLARGLLALTLALIVARIATGGGGEADQRGALEALTGTPPGAVLVAVCAAAFLGHAAWRALEAAGGRAGGGGGDRRAEALADGASALAYAALGVLCVAVLSGRSSRSEDQHSRDAAATVFGLPLGRPALALIGLGLIGGAVGIGVWAARRGFEKRLRTEDMSGPVERAVRWLEYTGEGARALLLASAGVLVVRAAVVSDPQQTRGLDGTLRELSSKPYGSVLLGLIAAGLAAWAAASALESFYLRAGDAGDGPSAGPPSAG